MKHVRILLDGQPVAGHLEGEKIVLDDGRVVAESSARYLAPVEPGKIIGTHLSYRSRCVEYAMKRMPETPAFFLKPPSSLSYHRAPVARPRGCRFLNYEGEIAIVIGKRCYGIAQDEALSYVRGYTIVNDWGVHDFRHADRGSMLRVKGQNGFCPLGPALVDAADVDLEQLVLRTYVNGNVVQEARVKDDLFFSFAYQIADLARLITLEPGDVLLTGTPAHSRPVEIGDVVVVEVEGLGRLENTVIELDHELEPLGTQPEITGNTLHVALTVPEDKAEQAAAAMKDA